MVPVEDQVAQVAENSIDIVGHIVLLIEETDEEHDERCVEPGVESVDTDDAEDPDEEGQGFVGVLQDDHEELNDLFDVASPGESSWHAADSEVLRLHAGLVGAIGLKDADCPFETLMYLE